MREETHWGEVRKARRKGGGDKREMEGTHETEKSVCVCGVCVCVWERQGETERHRQIKTKREEEGGRKEQGERRIRVRA